MKGRAGPTSPKGAALFLLLRGEIAANRERNLRTRLRAFFHLVILLFLLSEKKSAGREGKNGDRREKMFISCNKKENSRPILAKRKGLMKGGKREKAVPARGKAYQSSSKRRTSKDRGSQIPSGNKKKPRSFPNERGGKRGKKQ